MKTLCAMVHLVALAIASGFGAPASWAATTTTTAIVTAVRGTGTVDGKEVKVGTEILPGATLSTGSESIVDLNLKQNGPFLRLQPESRLSILELTRSRFGVEPEIVTRLRLESGNLSAHVRKTSESSRYTVETPKSVVSVRGICKCLIGADGDLRVAAGCANIRFREKDYAVCDWQGFDPSVPEVFEIIPPCGFAPPFPELPKPVGPVIHLSPVK